MLSEFENQQRHLLDGRFYPSPTHHTSCAGKARMIKCDKRTVSTNEANLFDPRLNMMGTSRTFTKKRMWMKKCLWCGLVVCKSAGSTLIIGNYFENKKGSKQQHKRTQNLDQNVTREGGNQLQQWQSGGVVSQQFLIYSKCPRYVIFPYHMYTCTRLFLPFPCHPHNRQWLKKKTSLSLSRVTWSKK